MSARWYVVHTKPNAELRADEHLRRQGYVTFLPKVKKSRRHARKADVVSRPFFPRYMFVQLDTAFQGWHAIRSTFGVVSLLSSENGPLPIHEGIVESLLESRGEDGHLRPTSTCRFTAGTAIRVVEGIFASACGVFERMSDSERVLVLLEMLGRRVRVTLDLGSVTAA